jgi:hypothetical protein
MEEVAPGLWHWKALRESIGSEVSSYYLGGEAVLIDPMVPPEGLGWFEEHGRPGHLLLTNRVVEHQKVGGRILGAPATRSVPRDNGEVVGEALELLPPPAAVGYASVQKNERHHPLAHPLEGDAEAAYLDLVQLAQSGPHVDDFLQLKLTARR